MFKSYGGRIDVDACGSRRGFMGTSPDDAKIPASADGGVHVYALE